MKNQKKHKLMILTVALLFAVVGSYNAIVINSDSAVSDIRFVKRLDERYGITTPGRSIAQETTWTKLSPLKKTVVLEPKIEKEIVPTADSLIAEAAVQEDLTLSLVEVINPKWKVLNKFSGSLTTAAGVIETLAVSLPTGDGLNISFTEMTGNVFEYDLNGELYSGMMYQVDQQSYMVTLTNGPLEGTRMRFSGQNPQEEQKATQEYLTENNNIEVGSFGQAPAEKI